MSKIKRIIALIILHTPVAFKTGWDYLCAFLKKNYKRFYLDYFELFFFHRYRSIAFVPFSFKENIKVLQRKRKRDYVRANRAGELSLVTSRNGRVWFTIQNGLLLGALQKRVERAVYLNFMVLTLEFRNPLGHEALKIYLERKEAFFDRLFKKIAHLNGKPFDLEGLRSNIALFMRGSYLQDQIVWEIEEAVRRQKEPQIIRDAKEGLAAGLYPVPIPIGRSGSYWMRNKNQEVVGLFKPFDEEPYAPHNPGGIRIQGALGRRKMRMGTRVGEAAHNEVAAFLTDAFFGLGIIPKTYYACFTHHAFYSAREHALTTVRSLKKKYGSFQEYIEGFVLFGKLDPEEIVKIPLEEFQTLLFFDVITGNSDRHLNNILIGDGKIAAIDHGFCFPSCHDDLEEAPWRALPQCFKPWHPGFKRVANAFPFEPLAAKLMKCCFRSPEAMDRMRERVALFRAAINADLLPHEMSFLWKRDIFNELYELDSDLNVKAEEIVADFVAHKEERMQPPLLQRWLHG